MTRRCLTLRGYDVAIEGRRPDGRAVVDVLDGRGRRAERYAQAWPHELRGIGWGLAEIRAAIAAAPLVTFASDAPSEAPQERRRAEPALPASPERPAAPRPLLFAHHVAAHRQED